MIETYGEARARIEDLYARYMFALDFKDGDAYASVFTEDGVLDWARGIVEGREAIRQLGHTMHEMATRRAGAEQPLRPSALRHFITNLTLKIDGDRAEGRASWIETNNDGRTRWPILSGYGHYEDELLRVDGTWLFTRRKVFNEILDARAAPPGNPVQW